MTLLLQGYGKQPQEWRVAEKKASGFSRVYYITDGDVFYNDKYQNIKLDINCLYIFPSCKEYNITHSSKNRLCCLWLHIDFFPTIVKDLIKVEVIKNQSLYYLLFSLKEQLTQNEARGSYFLSLVNSLSTYFYEQKLLNSPDDKLFSILSYINAHYKTAITIEQISSHFHYTTEHFIRMFQKKAGITPFRYLTNCKMLEAVRLLSMGVSVLEISKSLGYTDAKTFSHAFKQKFNLPPSKYTEYYKPTP